MKIGSVQWRDLIKRGARNFGLEVTTPALDGFSLHASEMIRFNRKMNLTRIINPRDIAIKHVIDSLVAAPILTETQTLIDVGAGVGFPGIPLKMVRPDLEVTLIDASARKVSFLKHVIRRLAIDGLTAQHARAEQYAEKIKKPFDAVITRAVGSLDRCRRWSLPLINAANGVVIYLRGQISEQDIKYVKHLMEDDRSQHNGELAHRMDIHRHRLPFGGDKRTKIVEYWGKQVTL